MSAYTAAKLFVQHEDNARDAITHDMWGHLAPKAGKHKVTLLASKSGYGGSTVTLCDEKTPDTLVNSPWSYNWLNTVIYDVLKEEEDGAYILEGFVLVGAEPNKFVTEIEWDEEKEEDIEIQVPCTDITLLGYDMTIKQSMLL